MSFHVPIVIYDLRLFIVVIQELHSLRNIEHDVALVIISMQSLVPQLCPLLRYMSRN